MAPSVLVKDGYTLNAAGFCEYEILEISIERTFNIGGEIARCGERSGVEDRLWGMLMVFDSVTT